MPRKMVYIQKVLNIEPIPNADNIECLTIGGWKVVSKKGEFQINDKCVYFEIDSILPNEEWCSFLGDRKRLRTIKLRGQISQGLALPLKAVGISEDLDFNTDLTELLGVEKYVPTIPAHLSGVVKGDFPSFLTKTDEERCQNLNEEIEQWQGHKFYKTEKLDGCSSTFYDYENTFGVCSRNLELCEDDKNTYWKMAKKYDLENVLKHTNLCLQGEICGPGIQGNPLQLDEQCLFLFNMFNIKTRKHYTYFEMNRVAKEYNIPCVPLLTPEYTLSCGIKELLIEAEGKSKLANVEREGVVYRDGKSISFKAISNKYLLKLDKKKKRKKHANRRS